MAQASPSAPTRTVFLLHGEDPFRTRLRLGELVGALLGGESTASGGLGTLPEPRLGALLGVARLDARSDPASAIALAGQSQGLFDAVDERRVVIVEHAEALREMDVVLGFPREAALVLVSVERLAAGRGRRGARARPAPAQPTSLVDAVDTAGGAVERIERLFPVEVGPWIEARARLHGIAMGPDAVAMLASAIGPDTERIEQEVRKLGAFAAGRAVSGADVQALVSGAIEADVFELTQAVVRRDARTAIATCERLLADGNAVQQILALLLWQFRVLLFASAMKTNADAERMAKAIRSTPGAIARATAFARRITRVDILRAYEAIYATDQVIKTGRAESDGAALMLCVLDLCGVAGADLRDMLLVEPPRRL
ncbi:MAG: DNA polymerase III subunit delta [Chloroflexi bacterium]|nr:MAG: DNA polymerase III subunit delta [Chloroflexota bacterium]TMG34940.1 MAG: DNA polymerase III subunit delta [Chloroflexota bacterium]